jgi:hypothetical protein
MRLSVASLRRRIKGKLRIEFVHQELRRTAAWNCSAATCGSTTCRAGCAPRARPTGGDYGGGRLARLVLALLYVGARRLEHLRYVAGDPLIARFCGLGVSRLQVNPGLSSAIPWPSSMISASCHT